MGVLEFEKKDTLGTVESVDTSTVVIRVDSDERIKGLQVNHLLAIHRNGFENNQKVCRQ